ncbi:MAG TPA: nuclear transport factor 2 family protein [Thermoanaerobaculia bacterium]|nr:nuclear transport factor 2 family protein [Thermoanaerobaculia bacterium]
MKRLLAALAVAIAATASGAEPPAADPSAQIIQLERAWGDCFVTGVPGPAKDFIADDFVGTTSKGARYDRARALQDIVEAKGQFKSMVVGDVTVRVYGDAAVARGTDSWEMTDGTKGAALWTDTWIRRRGTWQIVAAQDTPKPK